ncbi:hypothetical protein [Methylobacterium sp. Leaf125]|nr:hypothetical protein [Methylobacterium sp. Leaf125]
MSKNPRQRQRRFSFRFWLSIFKAIVVIGQLAHLVMKLFSLRE